ncbi:DUF6571 family protein [Streptomyces sp. NPDC005202]|uniref:DUF6571 family protein n=1 Tax=Streptomyces sp. NPDC005202 TaxID=3157021 RepID=UPI0033ABC81B
MDLDALRFADFSLLEDAIDDWSTMVTDLEKLKDHAENGLRGAANKADWAGVNATVSKEFIGKTAGEFADAHTQATSIRNILRDTCSELKGYQQKLHDALERGLKKNLTVMSTGDGTFTVTMNIHPDRAAQATSVPEHKPSDVTDLRDEVQKILNDATESDNSAKKVLEALVDQSRLGFSDASYGDRDAAADAVKEADELAGLAKKKPEDLTPEEFDRLNAGLKKYAHDDLFAEEFAKRLGADGTLNFWAGINDPHRAWELGSKRVEQFDDLQKNLGLTLANATQSDSAAMTDWKTKMVDMADKPVGRSGGFPLGAQVMSNLMRWGDYDDGFLIQYGDKLIETEKKFTGNGRHGAWQRMGMDPFLNRTGSDSGWDPMTGYLKALSNSPDAATTFLNQEFVSRNDENNPFERDTDGDGKKGKVSLSNFQYLFEERDWPHDQDDKGNDSIAGRNNLALALEAATTGHPAGEMPTPDTPPHNAEQAKLMQSLVSSVADDPERLTKHGYMSDSVGQIASEYLPDINRAMSDVKRDATSDDWHDIEKLYPVAGSEAELEHRDVSKLLFAIGQNDEGYAAVEVGQKAYMAKLMDYHLNPDLPADQRVSQDHELVVRQIAERSGEVSGTLGLGRQEAVGSPASEKDKEYDHSVSQYKNWISGGVGTAIGVGTSFIATPWVGAAVGGGAGTVTSVVLESVFKDAEGHAMDDAHETMGQRWQAGLVSNGEITGQAARLAAEQHHSADGGDAATWARESARQGYINARAILQGQDPGSITTS